jgi:hypothetical protein
MKTKAELDLQIDNLRKYFNCNVLTDGNIADLQKWFKNKFNRKIINVGDKLVFDFHVLFNMNADYREQFKNDYIQPITVTYLRLDVIFFTYDKHPEFGEKYTVWDADWMKWLYPTEIKQSVLWKHKKYLRKKDPNEYYIEVNLFDIDSKFVKYIKDIDFSDYN